MAVMLAGAATATFARSVIRVVIGLGVFLVGVALAFLTLGTPLVAISQVFLYVGGVLVLVLFTLMVVHRRDGERPTLLTVHDAGAAIIALGVFILLVVILGPVGDAPAAATVEPAGIGATLLTSSGLVAFELAGALLLAALLAVIAVVKGGAER
jgi:NADH-quinone oxidoreductase subunit J